MTGVWFTWRSIRAATRYTWDAVITKHASFNTVTWCYPGVPGRRRRICLYSNSFCSTRTLLDALFSARCAKGGRWFCLFDLCLLAILFSVAPRKITACSLGDRIVECTESCNSRIASIYLTSKLSAACTMTPDTVQDTIPATISILAGSRGSR